MTVVAATVILYGLRSLLSSAIQSLRYQRLMAYTCSRRSLPVILLTNRTLPSWAVVRFYNKRETAEQWIKEGKQAVKMTRLSYHRFRSNEVRLWLTILAYHLGNLWRRLVLPQRIGNWSWTSLQQQLVKTGGRLVNHARYYWFLLAESHLTRRLFASMLGRIDGLPLSSG